MQQHGGVRAIAVVWGDGDEHPDTPDQVDGAEMWIGLRGRLGKLLGEQLDLWWL